GEAEGLRRDADAAAVEPGHRDLEALALVAQTVLDGNAAVLEDELRGVRRADAELLFGFRHEEALARLLDQQRRDAMAAFRLHGLHEDERRRGLTPAGDEDLAAVDDVLVAVAPRERVLIRRVGARLRLGEREATDLVPRG